MKTTKCYIAPCKQYVSLQWICYEIQLVSRVSHPCPRHANWMNLPCLRHANRMNLILTARLDAGWVLGVLFKFFLDSSHSTRTRLSSLAIWSHWLCFMDQLSLLVWSFILGCQTWMPTTPALALRGLVVIVSEGIESLLSVTAYFMQFQPHDCASRSIFFKVETDGRNRFWEHRILSSSHFYR